MVVMFVAAFVMEAWSVSLGNMDGRVVMLSDGNLELTRALGMVVNGEAKGMGMRSRRYAMVVAPDLTIEHLSMDDTTIIKETRAAMVLSRL